MKKKVRVKSLPKAQVGTQQPPMVLTPQQQAIWQKNQGMFGANYKLDTPKVFDNSASFKLGEPKVFDNINNIPAQGIKSYSTYPSIGSMQSVSLTSDSPKAFENANVNPFNKPPKLSLYPRNTKFESGILSTGDAIKKTNLDKIPEDTRKLMGLEPFGDIKTKKPEQQKGNPYVGQAILAGTDIFRGLANQIDNRFAKRDLRDQFLSDNLAYAREEGQSGNRGDYNFNEFGFGPSFRPDDYIKGDYNKIAQMGGEMKRKVKITSLPQAGYGGSQNQNAVNQLYGNSAYMMNMFNGATKGEPNLSINQTMTAAPRQTAVLEAEGGETIVRPGQDGIPQLYTISGPDHNPNPNAQGGVPLDANQAPEGSFIFTKQKSLKIKNRDMQELLGLNPSKKGYVIADVSKKFNLNDPTYRKMLMDPNADAIEIGTAQRMLDNYTTKLGQLALIQEEMKGFPQGIPSVAHPYLQKIGINPEDMMPVNPAEGMQTAMYGGIPKAQTGFNLGNPSGAFNQYMPPVQQRIQTPIINQPRPAQKAPVAAPGATEYSVLSEIENYNPILGADLLKGQYGDYTTDYNQLKTTLEDPVIKEALLAEYNITHPKNKFTGTSEEFIKNYLDNQLHAYALTANYPSDILNSEDWDKVKKFGKENVVYDAAIKKLGLNPLDKPEIAKWQSGYQILGKLSISNDPVISTKLKQFRWTPEGVTDEKSYLGKLNVSQEDAVFGNTSNRQIAKLRKLPETPKGDDNYDQEDIEGFTPRGKRSDFYIQDIMNTGLGLANRLNINKYMPTMAQFEPELMEPTFYDPNRELANNAEMVNIAAANLAQFTGPQAFNSRFSDLQGRGLANAANISAKYNNLNVGVANQFEQANKQISNQGKLLNLKNTQDYLAGVAIANQQYDNAVNQGNTNLVQSGLVPAFTNRAKTQVMNQLVNDYAIDPVSGGMLYFNPSGRQVSGKTSQSGKPGLATFIADLEKDDPYFKALSPKEKYDVALKLNQTSTKTKRQADNEMLARYFGLADN